MSLHESHCSTNIDTISTVQHNKFSMWCMFLNLRNVTPAYLHVLAGYRACLLVVAVVVEGKAGGASSDSMVLIYDGSKGESDTCRPVWC